MHRVLIGQFGTVARMGLRELLDGQGIEVVGEAESEEAIFSCVSEVRPDVILLDLDDEEVLGMAEELTSEFPAIKVIACSPAPRPLRSASYSRVCGSPRA